MARPLAGNFQLQFGFLLLLNLGNAGAVSTDPVPPTAKHNHSRLFCRTRHHLFEARFITIPLVSVCISR